MDEVARARRFRGRGRRRRVWSRRATESLVRPGPGGTLPDCALAGDDGSLSAEILLRPTIGHPDLSHVLTDDDRRTVHLKLIRDAGRPVDALHVHGHAPREDSRIVEKAIWEQLSFDHGTVLPDTLGQYAPGKRGEALAIAQLLLLWHLLEARWTPG